MKKKYKWYIYYETICHECGRVLVQEKKVITNKPKPKDYYKRHIITPEWCYTCRLNTY